MPTRIKKSEDKTRLRTKKFKLKKRPPKVTSIKEESKIRPILKSEKYIKVLSTESIEKFIEIGKRVQDKELKWSSFAIENSIGVHYYLILKRNQR